MSKQDEERQSVPLTKLWVCLSGQISVDCDRLVKQVNQRRPNKYYSKKRFWLKSRANKLLIKLFLDSAIWLFKYKQEE